MQAICSGYICVADLGLSFNALASALRSSRCEEELLRVTVVQAKSRYHSALRSLEALSNQAHLRRGSSGVLEHHERRKNDSRCIREVGATVRLCESWPRRKRSERDEGKVPLKLFKA